MIFTMFKSSVKMFFIFLTVFVLSNGQEYDFGAEITRQCLVPDPVGLLDCVENKVTLPYLQSWVDCTNSLGENVKTSADIINYRCKSVWEGKGVIPEVFYIKDCVIEKTGLPAKNVSAEVLGAYKECESSPSQPRQDFMRIKSAPIQQQQVVVTPPQQISTVNSAPVPQQPLPPTPSVATYTSMMQQQQPVQAMGMAQQMQPVNVPQLPLQRQPYSQQYFMIYPQNPMYSQQQMSAPFSPQQQQTYQQQVQTSMNAFAPQQQHSTTNFVSQQQMPVTFGASVPQQQMHQSSQSSPSYGGPMNGPYYYSVQVYHPMRST